MSILLGSLIGPIILGWFAYKLQSRSWTRQNRQTMLDQSIKEAMVLTESLSRLIDDRLLHQRRLVWTLMAARRGDEAADLGASRASYRDAVDRWLKEFTRTKSMIDVYYGNASMMAFEYEVHGVFVDIGQDINRNLTESTSAKPLARVNRDLDAHAAKCAEFVKGLIELIKVRELGFLPVKDDIRRSSSSDLSRRYLVMRLLGRAN